MDFLITKRFPCSVCGLVTYRHDGWFLLIENRWLDHLKILTWHSSLATDKEIKSACSRHHLRMLIGHWLVEASLRLLPQTHNSMTPITSAAARRDSDLDRQSVGHLLGELSVHRETFFQGWTGSPQALECILDALVAAADQSAPCEPEYQFLAPPPNPHVNTPFTKALADLRRCLMQV